MRTGVFTHEDLLRHESGGWHPECPDRLVAAREGLRPYQADSIPVVGRTATTDELALVHSTRHIEHVQRRCARGEAQLDPDTYVNEYSWDAACLAAGGTMAVVDALVAGSIDRGISLVRPPGHHATPTRSMGFCLFNNIALAARHALERCGIERALIIDWDGHHGNGTQEAFWTDPDVAYFSVHQFPYFPGTGAAHEVGAGDGVGLTVNVPVPSGSGDHAFLAAFEQLWPLWDRVDPALVLVSAGFDAHTRDPLVGLEVTTEGFVDLAHQVLERAGATPVALVMEGGYDPTALTECWDEITRLCVTGGRS